MMSAQIESGVPIPPRTHGRKTRWPFLMEMKVGDSVLITDPAMMNHQLAVRLSALKRATGRRFTQRRVDGGVRVWRIE